MSDEDAPNPENSMSDNEDTRELDQSCMSRPPGEEAGRFDPAWRTSTVVALAAGIVRDANFDVMPILADALQDAGCDNDILLNHCRHGTYHETFCWVLDLASDPNALEELSGLPQAHVEVMSQVSAPYGLFLEATSLWCQDDSSLSERTRKWLTISTYVLFFAIVVAGSLGLLQLLDEDFVWVASGCVFLLGVPFIVAMPYFLAYPVCGFKAIRNRRKRRRR